MTGIRMSCWLSSAVGTIVPAVLSVVTYAILRTVSAVVGASSTVVSRSCCHHNVAPTSSRGVSPSAIGGAHRY